MKKLMGGRMMAGREPLSKVMGSLSHSLVCDPNRMEALMGKEWEKMPLGNTMEILSKRFDTRPFDYTNLEAKTVLTDIVQFANCLSQEQVKFLRSHDHLPRAEDTQRLWLDGDDLKIYEKQNPTRLYARRMEHFVMANGLITASMSVSRKDKKR
jgi:hypothetical protein